MRTFRVIYDRKVVFEYSVYDNLIIEVHYVSPDYGIEISPSWTAGGIVCIKLMLNANKETVSHSDGTGYVQVDESHGYSLEVE